MHACRAPPPGPLHWHWAGSARLAAPTRGRCLQAGEAAPLSWGVRELLNKYPYSLVAVCTAQNVLPQHLWEHFARFGARQIIFLPSGLQPSYLLGLESWEEVQAAESSCVTSLLCKVPARRSPALHAPPAACAQLPAPDARSSSPAAAHRPRCGRACR